MVTVGGEVSSTQYITLGTPQGSRLSALLFTILLADIDLWTDQSLLSNFADDTQSIIVGYNLEEVINITRNEANNVIDFFESNNLVNNALLCNSKGKKKNISIDNIGGEKLSSTNEEKLLGLHINSDFTWNVHVEKAHRVCA